METKNKMKIISSLVFLFSLFFSMVVSAEENMPGIVGSYGVSIDANTGEVLYDKEANSKALPASVTKVMTALLFVENTKEEDVITLSETCINMDRSNAQILFKSGEQLSRDTALFTMMTLSANDIACAVGEHISGSEEAFAKLMTKRAHELGAVNSNFENASGLHNPNHYTTAFDLALIAKEAIKHEELIEAMGTKEYTVNTDLQSDVQVTNPSKIHDDPDAIGGKTGYTNEARNTLLKIDEKNGIRVINVILGNNNSVNKNIMYVDIKKISNYAIEQLKKEKVIDKTKWEKTLTFLDKQVLVKPKETLYLTKTKTDTVSFDIKFIPEKINESLLYQEGIKTGQKLGVIEVSKGGQVIKTVDTISTKNLSFEKPKEILLPYWLKILMAIVIPICVYFGFVVLYNYKFFNNKKETS